MTMKFTYSSGQRPLDGFTLKRGIGRGGFGEVYFAVSDGGKEVALKLVRGNGDSAVELRGVAHCLNLKHPNLVGLYDLRKDSDGNPWVVMEYIAGEPLNVVLARHPDGLPRELAREWFLGLARAVGHLHDHGIVHRDLKPGNIFLENGTVKVGDYGLSKSISTSQHKAQTMSVGTVHYMAPEISTGNYNKQIDTYAAGIILYEMLTGHVPFEGESAGEILMKHLDSPLDLSRLPGEFVPVVAKALAKNPLHRHASLAEMVRAVETAGDKAAPRAPAIPVATPVRPAADSCSGPARRRPGDPVLTALPADTSRSRIAELGGSMVLSVLLFAASPGDASGRRFEPRPGHHGAGQPVLPDGWALLLDRACAGEVLDVASRQHLGPASRHVGPGLGGRASGLLAGAEATLVPITTPFADATGRSRAMRLSDRPIGCLSRLTGEAGYLSYYALAFFAVRWWRMTDRRRTSRFSFFPVLTAATWGLISMTIVGPRVDSGGQRSAHPWGTSVLVLVLTSIVVQMVSPWEPPPPPAANAACVRAAP